MQLTVDSRAVHVSTGGRQPERKAPWIVFVHGAGFTHHIWIQQGRALAHDGWNMLAPDLPGHGQSGGTPLASVAEMADWLVGLLDAAGCRQAVVVGHSLGGLVALEAAATKPQRFAALVLIGTAAAIPVNSTLIDTAVSDPDQARAFMISRGFGSSAHLHENTWPGASHIFAGMEIMRRNGPQVLAIDLKACDAYRDGPERAKAIHQPSLCIFGERDRMVPAKRGLELAQMLATARSSSCPAAAIRCQANGRAKSMRRCASSLAPSANRLPPEIIATQPVGRREFRDDCPDTGSPISISSDNEFRAKIASKIAWGRIA